MSFGGDIASHPKAGVIMKPRYEYKFVRLEGRSFFGLKRAPREDYQQHIHNYAREGWRLVQVFAPAIGIYGAPTYYELILEREIP